MKRDISDRLTLWLKRSDRLPLIIKGARQVGKTFAIKQFLKESKDLFGDYHIFNFEEEPSLKEIFQGDLIPDEITRLLSLKRGAPIAETDLLFFDEIQLCPLAITSLKYFAEKRSTQPIICAGSLLGVELNERSSFPVGKVQYETMRPMSFLEFLNGINDTASSELLFKIAREKKAHQIEHSKLMERYKDFSVTGGMPKAVMAYNSTLDKFEGYKRCREIQANLIRDYLSDFIKYSGTVNAKQLSAIFNNIPQQLWKVRDESTKRFIFSEVLPSSKLTYSRLETPIQWLTDAGIAIKIKITEKLEIPINANTRVNFFKLYPLDIGILGAQLMLEPSKIILENYGTVKGYMAEMFVLQELLRLQDNSINSSTPVCYQAGDSEIEFIVDINGEIVPIEVKSSNNTRARSLSSYIKKYKPSVAVKFYSGLPHVTQVGGSSGNSGISDSDGNSGIKNEQRKGTKLYSLPIYLVGVLKEVLSGSQIFRACEMSS